MTTSPITSIRDELLAELPELLSELYEIASGNDADGIAVHGIKVGHVRALLAERAELKRAERNRDMWKAQCEEQAVKLAELKRDAERLEWIVDQVAMVHTYPGRDGASYCVYWPDSESEQAYTHATPREAIDQAMQEAKP